MRAAQTGPGASATPATVPATSSDQAPGWSGVRTALAAMVLVAAVFASYRESLSAGFAWLDQREIVEGALVVESPGELLALLGDDRNYTGYHRPLYNLAHSLDRALWGLDPRGFHLSSLALHALCALLAMALACRLGLTDGQAFAVALLFALHPVNSAVAGLIHAKADLLVTAALLGAACLALRRTRAGAIGSLGCFALALFCKETAFVYPLLVAAAPALRIPGAGRRARGYVTYLLAVAALAAAAVLARFALGAAEAAPAPPLLERLLTFAGVYVGYVRTLLIPTDLSVSDTVTTFSALSTRLQAFTLSAFAALVVLQVALWIRRPALRKWIALFDLALLPVAQVVPILHFRADRFLYLPSLAFAGLAVEGLSAELRALGTGRGWRSAATSTLGSALVLAAALGYGQLVRLRVPFLHDDAALFGREVARTPDYREGLAVLARHHQRKGAFDTAQVLLERALAPSPGRLSYVDLDGVAVAYAHNLLALKRPAEARAFADAWLPRVRGAAREELAYNQAVAAWHLGDHAAAVRGLAAYRARHPDDPGCLYLLGTAALELGDRPLAREALSDYLALDPDPADRTRVEALLEQAAP